MKSLRMAAAAAAAILATACANDYDRAGTYDRGSMTGSGGTSATRGGTVSGDMSGSNMDPANLGSGSGTPRNLNETQPATAGATVRPLAL